MFWQYNVLIVSSIFMTRLLYLYAWAFVIDLILCEIKIYIYVMRCAIWYHLDNWKNVKNTPRGVLILVKLQAEACNFTKINTPPWVFFTFFELYKWYQIAQRTTYITYCHKKEAALKHFTKLTGKIFFIKKNSCKIYRNLRDS